MNNDLISREALKKVISEYIDEYSDLDNNGYHCEKWCAMKEAEMAIDNAPTVETKFELKTENGITYPKALDNMTFSHSLSVEERQNIIQAYMLGTYANERPQGEWIFDGVYRDENNPIDSDMYHCNLCKRSIITTCSRPEDLFPFCHCGADMRKGEKE